MQQYAAERVEVPMPESALFDLDTPEDYREALERLAALP